MPKKGISGLKQKEWKFQLKLTILIFWTKFAQKGYFRFKTERVNTTIEFCIFELNQVPNFSLNRQFWFFRPSLPKKVFLVKKGGKKEHHHWMLHIRINPGTIFQLKLTILISWNKFSQKGCFRFKTEKVNTAIEFCIFELVQVPNFILNWQFSFFDQVCTKRVFPVKNGESEHHQWILHIRISLGKNFSLHRVLIFFWPNSTKQGIFG